MPAAVVPTKNSLRTVRNVRPEQPIDRTKARSFRGGPLQYGESMSERKNFRRELEPRADCGSQRGQQGDQ
jgi:hypothetical protein